MKLTGKNILVISNEAWGDIWFSKHNYAHELSKKNNVVFVDPPGSWRPGQLNMVAPSMQRVSEGLNVLRYRNALPIANKLLYDLNDRIVCRSLGRFLREHHGFKADLFLTFDPIRLTNPALLDPALSVFLCVDKYNFKFYGERDLCRNVDAIITVSDIYTVRYAEFDKPKLTIAHAVAEDEFERSPSPDPLKDYGLYVGTIDQRVDHALVEAMLKRFPQVPFVFIGRMGLPENDPARALYLSGKFPNLHYRGVKHFKDLRPYVSGSRFCLSPLDLRYPGNHISHHKTLQYLAQGKPIFSCVFDDYRPVAHLMYMENDHGRWLDRLERFLQEGEDPALSDGRIAFARTRTFARTFDQIESFLGTVTGRGISPAQPRTIFLFSNEPWSDMWYSKHHYAAELAKRHEVYFVNMPERWRPWNLFSLRARTHMTPEGVHVVDYSNTLPRKLGPFIGRWGGRKLLRLRPKVPAICWSFNPLALEECRSMQATGAKLIYHTVDPYQSFPEDKRMASSADLVVCVNQWFFDHYAQHTSSRLLIPHGVRTEDRMCDATAVERLRSEHGSYALFAASLSEYANFPLMTAAADRSPHIRILVAGSIFPLPPRIQNERDAFLARPNVTYLGVKHPDELRNLARGATVGLLAYDFEPKRMAPISGGRTPLKVLTYLAQHCPVVSTNNVYIPELDDRGCFKAEDTEGFLALMAKVLAGELRTDPVAVDHYLDAVGYPKLIDRILARLDETAA